MNRAERMSEENIQATSVGCSGERPTAYVRKPVLSLLASDPVEVDAKRLDLFISALATNVNNEKLSDLEFRRFARNSLSTLSVPPERHVVMTSKGQVFRVGNHWFKRHSNGKAPIKDGESITDWWYVDGLPKA